MRDRGQLMFCSHETRVICTVDIAGSMLCQRRRRWHNIKPTLGQRLVFTGYKQTICTVDDIHPSKQLDLRYEEQEQIHD